MFRSRLSRLRLLFAALTLLGGTCSLVAQDATVSQDRAASSLFDGHSLDGWEYDAKYWRVENQAIVGEIPKGTTLNKNTWIVWKDGELRDFDLRLQVKLTGLPAANSGIQIRCQVDNVDHVSGYQADLDMGATWLGRIYDEHGRALIVERGQRVLIQEDGTRVTETFAPPNLFAAIFRENDWNDYRIVGIGERIAVYVNGTLFADLVDREINAKDLTGRLAFQLHSGPETRVEFRSISLETLKPDDQRLGGFQLKPKDTAGDAPDASDQGSLPKDNEGDELNLDFETGGLVNWTATGTAFDGQPVANDTIAQRWAGQVSNKQGDYFVGGYERSRSDAATGTLTSDWFVASMPFASFLVGGGRTETTRVDILLKSDPTTVIASASGDQREQMRRVLVDLREHQGQQIAVRLIDESTGGWGHLNFDDFRLHPERPDFPQAGNASPLFHPLLHHLVDNTDSAPAKDAHVAYQDTLAKMSVAPGFAVDLIAAEPDVHQPMAFAFDARGRLWVVEGHSYPTKRPDGEGLDKVLIFEDADHDGRFEKRTVFYEGLNLVSGMQVGHGGVWIGAAPQLLFIPDRNRDDIADGQPEVLLDGFGFADTHETLNSFVWGPDGWLYGNQGVFNQSQVGRPGASDDERVYLAAGVWRYHPVRHRFEVFAHGGSNQWGLDFDDLGQLFMTHCRSHYGQGPTTHVMQGGHYWNQTNSGYASFVSSEPVAGVATMKNYLLASARYGHGEGGAGKTGSRALYGGHSHVGTMIYLGDNWPAEYRNHLFTHNLHGHRINHQINLPEGAGFNTVHAGYDLFHCSDPQYIGVDLQYGPDGAVYISDWYDPRHCHSPHTEQWQRGNGRMYRLYFEGYEPAVVNYHQASDQELVDAQTHANDWHVRAARLELAERATRRDIDPKAVSSLKQLATQHTSPQRRLRAIWCLHGIHAIDRQLAHHALHDANPYIRGWTVQLLADQGQLPGQLANDRDALIASLLEREDSPIVKRYLASAADRLPAETAWRIIHRLASDSSINDDRNLPFLFWQTCAERITSELDEAIRILETTPVQTLRDYLQWYLPQLSDEARATMVERLAGLDGADQVRALQLFAAGLQGSRNLKMPKAWPKLARQMYGEPVTRRAAERVGTAFNDPTLYERMRETLATSTSSDREKHRALAILASDNAPNNLPLLLELLESESLRLSVLRQLAKYDSQRVAGALIERLPSLEGDENEAAMEALCARPASATLLLQAIGQGAVPKEKLTGFYARQLAMLRNKDVSELLERHWGRIGQSSEQARDTIDTLVQEYSKAPLWAYDGNAGAAHFNKLCANCHTDQENVRRIGPKLEGTGAKGIRYVVENIVDPNAVVGRDFQARNIETDDGRVIVGVIVNETNSAITLRTANDVQTIAKNEIEEMSVSTSSFMPEGLLQTLNERQTIELLKYLMSLQ